MKDPIGERLLRAEMITQDQYEMALDYQRNEHCKSYEALVKLQIISDEGLVEFLARELGVPTVSLDEIEVDPEAIKRIPPDTAQKYMAIPYGQVDSTLHVAMVDPTDENAKKDIEFRTGLSVEVSLATQAEI